MNSNKKLYPALINKRNGKLYGYINVKGEWIIKPKYNNAYNFTDKNIAIVEKNNKYGLIDNTGKYIIYPKFDSISNFKENRAVFNLDNFMGVIDEKGKIINESKYQFISDYNEGRAIVGTSSEGGFYSYGYIDLNGNEIIKPKYQSASQFNEGFSIVKINDNEYALINLNGEIESTYKYNTVFGYGNGLMVFSKDLQGTYGYVDKKGNVVIQPLYEVAEGFKDNVAIVSEGNDFNGPYGLIDLKGEYILKPIYDDIKMLGEEMIALGKSIGEDKFVNRKIYAIGTTKGKILTDFIYLQVGEYKDNISYASDEEYTFFIDKSGKIVKNLPIVKGSGQLYIENNIIYSYIDYEPYYLYKSGKIMYKPSEIIKLNNKYFVINMKYKPNINYLIYYPKVEGVKSKKVERSINSKLKEMSYFKPYGESDDNNQSTVITKNDILNYDYYGDFSVKFFKKDLLILDITGYYYPIGAAHGMPSRKTPSINLVTGKFYTIGDLFMGGVYWLGEINKIIEKIIATDKDYDYVFKEDFKGIKFDQDFYIDQDNLYIYFSPYEIGPYSAGFITFKIPFSEIQRMINKNGEFYKSFN
ncbi:WG repeat-containing protein [Clostridium ihumii]|uniref:WG repeat-containing protein n=1 Tax=Clostridium ihumii TaxID=1470356 RepID=UPI000684DAB7|nr:WG repeat-containing protein [Clostridium ihumii]